MIPLVFLPFHYKRNIYTCIYKPIYLNYILCIMFWGRYFMLWREKIICRTLRIWLINILYRFYTLNICICGTTDRIGERHGVFCLLWLNFCMPIALTHTLHTCQCTITEMLFDNVFSRQRRNREKSKHVICKMFYTP